MYVINTIVARLGCRMYVLLAHLTLISLNITRNATHNRTCASTLTDHNAYYKQPLWHTSVFLLSTRRKRWYCSFILIHIWNMCKRNICWGFQSTDTNPSRLLLSILCLHGAKSVSTNIFARVSSRPSPSLLSYYSIYFIKIPDSNIISPV